MINVPCTKPKHSPTYHNYVFDVELHPSIPISRISLVCSVIKQLQYFITQLNLCGLDMLKLMHQQTILLGMLTVTYNKIEWYEKLNASLKMLGTYDDYNSDAVTFRIGSMILSLSDLMDDRPCKMKAIKMVK